MYFRLINVSSCFYLYTVLHVISHFLTFFKNVYEWEQHGVIHQPPIIVAEEGKVLPPLVPKSLYKIVSEHKDVTKVNMCLFSAWLNF